MSGDFTPAERAALDRVGVPPLRGDFAARVLAAASAAPELPPRAPRRRLRGVWRQHRTAVIGIGALLLTSAAAAATGVIYKIPMPLPSLAAVIGTTAPAPEPKPKPRPKTAQIVRRVPDSATPPVPIPSQPALPQGPFAQRHPVLAERVKQRIAAMTPEQRVAAAARIRQRISAMPPEQRAAAAARVRERVRDLSPEERQQLRDAIRARREQRLIDRKGDIVPGSASPVDQPLNPPTAIEQPTVEQLPPAIQQRIERRRALRELRRQRREGFSEPIR